jgi:hypothetical protein
VECFQELKVKAQDGPIRNVNTEMEAFEPPVEYEGSEKLELGLPWQYQG